MHEQTPLNQLLSNVASHDVAALHTLYNQTAEPLYGLALTVVGHPDAAQRVMVDSFLAIWRAAADATAWHMPAQTWTAQLVRTHALAELHRNRLAHAASGGAHNEDLAQAHGLHVVAFASRHGNSPEADVLAQAMANLPLATQTAVGLTYLRAQSLESVATHLRMDPQQIRVDIHRALHAMGAARPADRMAACWVLGCLQGGAAPRLEALAERHASVRGTLLTWQTRLAALCELQTSQTVPDTVWEHINQRLLAAQDHQHLLDAKLAAQAKVAASVFTGAWWHSVALWRTLAIALVLAGLLAAGAGMSVYEMMNSHIVNLTKQLQKASKGKVASPTDAPATAAR